MPLATGRYACTRCERIGRRTASGIQPLKPHHDGIWKAMAHAEWSRARDAAALAIQRGRYGVDYLWPDEE